MSDDLRGAARALVVVARRLERACGSLSLAQFRVLSLVAGGDERASLVAERLAVAKPTITAVVDGLVERGYLVREAVEGDRRSIRLRITPDGEAAMQTAEGAMAESLDGLFAGVSDRDGLVRGLAELHEAWLARVDARFGAVST